jgi:uncharacterized protein (TIGR03066 family)
MAVLRAVLVGCLLLAVASVGLAQKDKAKIDKSKLVGKWTFVKTTAEKGPPPGAKITVEFTKDGKFTINIQINDKSQKMTGTYSVSGDELTVTTKMGDKERKETNQIKELTDKKLVVIEENKKDTTEFKK